MNFLNRSRDSAGAHVNMTNTKGDTALILAAPRHPEVVSILLKAGADIASTALILAALMNQDKVISILLCDPMRDKINIDSATEDGTTALMTAVERGYVNVIKLLLNAGADPRVRDKKDRIAADYTKNDEILSMLREAMQTPEKSRDLLNMGLKKLINSELSPLEGLQNNQKECQQATSLAIQVIIDQIDFLLAHKEGDFRKLPQAITRFSELLLTLEDNLDKKTQTYTRSLFKLASRLGDGMAMHIASSFFQDQDEEIEKEKTKEVEMPVSSKRRMSL